MEMLKFIHIIKGENEIRRHLMLTMDSILKKDELWCLH